MKIFYNGYKLIEGNRLITATQELSFNSDLSYYQKLKSVLKIRRAKDVPFVRVGKIGDGGYIMADNFSQGGGWYSILLWNFQ